MSYMTNIVEGTAEQKVAELDLTEVMALVEKKTGLDAVGLAHAELLYRRFLVLMAKNPDQNLKPIRLVDVIWSLHAALTMQYAADCESLFGTYVSRPEFSFDDASFAELSKLYEAEFETPLNLVGNIHMTQPGSGGNWRTPGEGGNWRSPGEGGNWHHPGCGGNW